MYRIAVDCRMIGTGGIGSFISELLPYFIDGNECLLIGTHEQCADFIKTGEADFCFCDIQPFSVRELIGFPPDVCAKINHCDFYFTPYCNIPAGITIPIFSTIHDVVFLDVPGLTGFFGKKIRKLFYQRAVNASAAVFTVSEFSRERILHHLRCKKPLEIVYNAAPAYLAQPLEAPVQKRNQILFVGNIKKHKGLHTLLDAFEIASENGFSAKLVIVGNADNFRTGDVETVRRLSGFTAEKIEFTGRITNDELKMLYAQSRFLVQPSLYEGFGIPPLEALTVGTPALVSDIPVFKEIYAGFPVEFFKTGNAQDLAQKMLAFKDHEIDARELPGTYSYKNSAEKILDVMVQLTKSKHMLR